eukprot:Gregarina_sp_Poly_1__11291@NODE_940_length_5625_cov_84_879813_g666_i0_p2_GENE_NODE_940_length_5625_cov_84_879813_g666_i0NODE_940_length_5625_cov_84_879813_g666_i0_p2_ORF_typecomplete_len149_score6_46_NODE_940_length_5625_cov_84_879813_g666_i011621608
MLTSLETFVIGSRFLPSRAGYPQSLSSWSKQNSQIKKFECLDSWMRTPLLLIIMQINPTLMFCVTMSQQAYQMATTAGPMAAAIVDVLKTGWLEQVAIGGFLEYQLVRCWQTARSGSRKRGSSSWLQPWNQQFVMACIWRCLLVEMCS